MQPWPTAYTYLHRAGKPPLRVIIYKAEESGYRMSLPAVVPPPGRIETGSGVISVDCGSRPGNVSVGIFELQPAGKKRMSAEEFLRGYPLTDGDWFGPEAG